jgi:hypothetical protein
MLDGQPGHFVVVRAQKRKRKIAHTTPQIHDGHAELQQSVGHSAIVNSREHAVAFPAMEPARRRFSQPVWLEVSQPLRMVSVVPGDSTQNAAPVLARRLDQQSNVSQFRHGAQSLAPPLQQNV